MLLLALALCAPACGDADPAATVQRAPARRPDVVLISIDSLRPDHLGCYGYPKPTSPTIDRLAAEGARFDTAVSTTSWTLPAHAAMFTGLYDSAHGLVDNGLELDAGHATLAESFASAGWHTAGFYGGPYLHPTFGLDQGFETWTSCMTTTSDDEPEADLRRAVGSGKNRSHEDVTGPRTLEAVERWAAQLDGRPFFLFLHLWDVHYDYIPPREYVEMFDPGYEGTLDARNLPRNPAVHVRMAERDKEHLLALYDGEIRFTDDVLAKILAVLEAKGRLENALVVVTADHGEEFFEHGAKGHQRSLNEEVVRVPLIVRWPGVVPAGAVVETPARLIDLYPTIASLAGVACPPVQGRDLAPALRGERLEPEAALLELLVRPIELRAWREDEFKVIRGQPPKSAPVKLGYDLEADPREQRPVPSADERIPVALRALDEELERSIALRESRGIGASPFRADASIDARLRTLGYTGDDER